MATERPLVVIVGPTASGKSALAIDIAEQYGGEIICADSRTVYKDMNVGTAKPSVDDRERVPHHGLDLVIPSERFTAADFKNYASKTIEDIRRRDKLPLLVGGTGLYVDGVVYDYKFGGSANTTLRNQLEELTVEQLQEYCIYNNIPLPENRKNKRYLVRAIERQSVSGPNKSPKNANTHIVGIATNMDTLRTRIVNRTEHLFENDVVQEATMLDEKYGWNNDAMTGNIYPLLKLHLEGQMTVNQVKDEFTTLDYRLAKRQMTWFRRNPDIMWSHLTEAKTYLQSLLAAE